MRLAQAENEEFDAASRTVPELDDKGVYGIGEGDAASKVFFRVDTPHWIKNLK